MYGNPAMELLGTEHSFFLFLPFSLAESAGLFAQSQGAWFLHLCVHTFQAQGSTHGRSSTVEE